jgi:hypothetical protein
LFCRQKYKGKGLFHIYIITYETNLENQKDYEIETELPDEMQSILETVESVTYLSYHIEGRWCKHEVVCPRYTFAGGGFVVVIPWFLIPGRPYPVQVYLYASGLYSANPAMGQRAAAKATRAEFGLEKFSHSTVSRSFAAFEQSRKLGLTLRYGEEVGIDGTGTLHLVSAAVKIVIKREESPDSKRRFPSAKDTTARRREMAVFLREFLHTLKEVDIEHTSRQFIKNWNKKARRLLL